MPARTRFFPERTICIVQKQFAMPTLYGWSGSQRHVFHCPVIAASFTPATRQVTSACTSAASAFMTSPAAVMISSGVRAFCWASLRTWSISPAVASDACASAYSR